ncbi:MAG: DoxX family protein [Nanoarchaeota archaeon]|nr:DoxX family protein [Nanoarchaeota archaeon]
MKTKNIIIWITRLVAAGILFETLFYKFTAHPDSVMLFTALGVEPWGRIALGVIELITGIAILVPRTSFKGALASIGLMIGAIITHLAVIGVSFNNDGGALFSLAIIVFIVSSVNVYLNRDQFKNIGLF